MKSFIALSVLLSTIAGTLSARLPSNLLAEVHSEEFGLLRELPSHIAALGRQKREDWTEEKAYATIKFTVPPSKWEEFEDAWLKLESEVKDKEESWEVFDLKSSELDNLFYWSYGEWETVEDFIMHLRSDWFKDFAEEADKLGVVWSLQCLKDWSSDLEEKEKGRKEKRGGAKEDEFASVLIYYILPPGEDKENFIDQWRDTAKTTLSDERGNRIYSLASDYNDNTKFYAYGTWDSKDAYIKHFYSEHVTQLREYLAKKDIVWFVIPLEKVGNQPE